jgi:glutamate dehydrogenase/leucine dehydrogenase
MIAKACPEYSLDKPSTLVAISGSGNVSQFTALKVLELGATVLSLSDSKGSLISEKGYTKEFIHKIAQLKLKGGALETLANEPGYTYHAGMSIILLGKLNLLIMIDRQAPLDFDSYYPHRSPWCHPERGLRRGG